MAIGRPHRPAAYASTSARTTARVRTRDIVRNICCFTVLLCGAMQWLNAAHAVVPVQRREIVHRERGDWEEYIEPLVRDGSFRRRYRMSKDDFDELYQMLRPRLEKGLKWGTGRNGTVRGEWSLAGALRWLAGGTIEEVMMGPNVAKSTAYRMVHDGIDAIVQCKRLRIKFPQTPEELQESADGFRARSSEDVLKRCVGAADGLIIRILKPNKAEHACPDRFYSGHKKTVGINLQAICNSNFAFIGVSMNTPGSTNDRKAWRAGGWEERIADLPDDFYILGDAAYGPTEKMIVPYPGTNLERSRDVTNYYQSQGRMVIEQAFGILVRTWGIFHRPLEVPLCRTANVVHAAIRLHNFLRARRATPPLLLHGPALTEDGLLANPMFQPTNSGRPGGVLSMAREKIRRDVERRMLVRPVHNVERNRSWTQPSESRESDSE